MANYDNRAIGDPNFGEIADADNKRQQSDPPIDHLFA
jgi:hypothetical protein